MGFPREQAINLGLNVGPIPVTLAYWQWSLLQKSIGLIGGHPHLIHAIRSGVTHDFCSLD